MVNIQIIYYNFVINMYVRKIQNNNNKNHYGKD